MEIGEDWNSRFLPSLCDVGVRSGDRWRNGPMEMDRFMNCTRPGLTNFMTTTDKKEPQDKFMT